MEKDEKLCNIGKMVKYIDGDFRHYDKVVGFCKYAGHKGYINAKLAEEHECFKKECSFLDPVENHMYWIQKESQRKQKNKIKEKRKQQKEIERTILEKTKEVSSDNVEFVMCKHLYDSTYILIVMKSIHFVTVPPKLLEELGVNVYVKEISERQRPNIEYTYKLFLPEDMQKKMKK